MIFSVLYLISKWLNLFPARWNLFWGDCLGGLWYRLVPIRRSTVLKNLRDCFGNSLSDVEIERLALQNYHHYGRTLFEMLRSFAWSKEQFRHQVAIDGFENLDRCLASGKGAFLLTLHLGNWEVGAGAIAASGIPFDIVVKHSRTRWVERLLRSYRTRSGLGIFLESKTAKDILKSLSHGRVVGFMLDQFMGPPIGLPVHFFGRKAGTAVALALLSEKKNVPILPTYCYRDSHGKLHVAIAPPLRFPALSEDKNQRFYEKTQLFNDVLEAVIRKHPEQWLWLHRRWKEYRGEPRWLPRRAMVLSLFLFFMWGCASKKEMISPTGILLPPDKEISVPLFEESEMDAREPDKDEVTESEQPHEQVAGAKPERKSAVLSPSSSPKSAKGMVPAQKMSSQVVVTKPALIQKNFRVIPADRIPFELGERLEVELFWNVVPVAAGRAVIEVREGPTIQGRRTWHLLGNVLSSKIVDYIYHVDNTIESFVDADGLIPYRFFLHMLETHQKKETKVEFDHPAAKASYWAKRLSQKWKDDHQDRVDTLEPGARDMFSALYYARTIDYTLNKMEKFFIYENGQNWQVELIPVSNELVVTRAGAFQCWKILVSVHLNNILKPLGDSYMWVSDDSKKYVVKFSSKIKVGSVVGNLVSIQERRAIARSGSAQ